MKSKKSTIFKTIAIIFMICYMGCFFTGWIQAKNDFTKDVLKQSAKEFMLTVDNGDISLLDEDLKAVNCPVTSASMVVHMRQTMSILNDGAVSPFEAAFKTTFLLDFYRMYKSGLDLGVGDVFGTLSTIRLVIIILRVCFIFTMAYMILSIVMTIKGGRFYNIFAIVLAAAWFVVWFGAYILLAASLTGTYYASVNMGPMFSVTGLLPGAFAILALIFAIIGNKKNKKPKRNEKSAETEDNEENGKGDSESNASDNVNSDEKENNQFMIADERAPESTVRVIIPNMEKLDEFDEEAYRKEADAILGQDKEEADSEATQSENSEAVVSENADDNSEENKDNVEEVKKERKVIRIDGMAYVSRESIEGNFIKCPACHQINDTDMTKCIICGCRLYLYN